jgi:hypothetical protein
LSQTREANIPPRCKDADAMQMELELGMEMEMEMEMEIAWPAGGEGMERKH